jgi:hypothetical protein
MIPFRLTILITAGNGPDPYYIVVLTPRFQLILFQNKVAQIRMRITLIR